MGDTRFRCRNLFLAFTFVLPILAHAQSAPWFSKFESAFTELKAGQLNHPLEEFNALWKAHRQDVNLATSIGGVLDATAHHEQATVWYERALSIQPDFGQALDNLALNFAARGRLNEAASLFHRTLDRTPGDGKVAYNLASILLRLRRYADALTVLTSAENASTTAPLLEQIRFAQATALFHLARYSEVVNVLRKEGKPGSVSAFQLLGSAQALSGDLPASIQTFQQAIAAYPTDPDLYFRLAMVFARGRRDQDAEAVLRSSAERIGDSPSINYGRAILAEMVGRDEEAITWARQSVRAAEKQPEVWGLLGTLYDHRGSTEDALEAYRTALQYGGNGPYIGADYAELLIRLGRYEQAAIELHRLTHTYPADAQVNRALGRLYRAQGKYIQAEEYLRRSIRTDASNGQTHYVLAQVLRHQGRTKEESEELAAFKNAKEKTDSIRVLEIVEDPR